LNNYYINNIINNMNKATKTSIERVPLSSEEKNFIQEVAALLAPRGLASSTGRVYGYLLLRQGPVSLDQIAEDLEMSKVSAWKAARGLETSDHVRRYGVPGSKRAMYAASENFGAPFMEQAAVLGTMGELLQKCASSIATGAVASKIEERAHFYQSIRRVMEEKIDELNSERTIDRQ